MEAGWEIELKTHYRTGNRLWPLGVKNKYQRDTENT